MSSRTKRQQTAAKRNREQAVREKRERKREKKQAAALARQQLAAGITPAEEGAEEPLPESPAEQSDGANHQPRVE
jgi:hypothetical protein